MTSTTLNPRPGSVGTRPARGLIRWVCSNNPFYAISAALVFLGLRGSFAADGPAAAAGALMLGLAGYTLLLAVTAVTLIRIGQVWDDVRTILLLIVLMFLAISVSFDYTLVANPGLGLACYLGGLSFALAVTECVLRGIRLRLPALYRVPYLVLLSLFFVYPIGLARLADRPGSAELQWALFGFSPLAGLAFLTLIPAVRRGPEYVAKNGSPWRWPLYPWVLFGVMAACVGVRCYSLCVSFHFVLKSQSIFGPFVLVPFALALGVLILEAALRSRRRQSVWAALTVPVVLVVLAATGHRVDPVYLGFQDLFRETLGGTPLYLTLIAAVGFYAYAAWRGVRPALDGMALALAGLAVVGRGTLDVNGLNLEQPDPWPLLVVAVLQGILALRQGASARALVAAVCAVVAVGAVLPAGWDLAVKQAVLFHLLLVAVLAIGAIFDDALGPLLRLLGGGLLLGAALASLSGEAGGLARISPTVAWAYAPSAAVAALVYGAWVGGYWYYAVAGACLGAWCLVTGWGGYVTLRRQVAGLDQITLGLACFLVAAAISLWKAGVLPRWWPLARQTEGG